MSFRPSCGGLENVYWGGRGGEYVLYAVADTVAVVTVPGETKRKASVGNQVCSIVLEDLNLIFAVT